MRILLLGNEDILNSRNLPRGLKKVLTVAAPLTKRAGSKTTEK
jgi:hypothetical protein